MTNSTNLNLPYIDAAQAQKHVTHNEALRILDTLVQLAVLDRDLATPPGSPSEGQRWIVAASPTGGWVGHAKHIAAWQDGAWQFSAPVTGWLAYVIDEGALLAWNGSTWIDALSMLTTLQNIALLGVGTTADTTNPLSAKLNNALWIAKTAAEGGTGDLRYKLSKENAGKTLSLLLQNNFSGRAEMGLTGDDDFHFKVSPNGSTWFEGIRIDRNTGKVSFPVSGGPREVLAANRTYYVRTDGSDANTGLANTSGGAFLTIQKAIDTVAALDLAAYSVTIQVGNGTYGGLVAAKSYVGAGPVTIVGDETTPSNVTISSAAGTSGTAVLTFDTVLGKYVVKGLKLTSSVSGQHGLYALNGSIVDLQNVDFGALNGGWHMLGAQGGQINTVGNYKISGGAAYHVVALQSGSVSGQSITVTLTGTPAFTSAFARATRSGTMKSAAITYSGAATGPRYFAEANGVVYAAGGGPNYFPGDSAGSAATGGQYV